MQSLNRFQPGHPWQTYVENHGVRTNFLRGLQSKLRRTDSVGGVAQTLRELGQAPANALFVINEEQM
jgi:hypothetical protein